MPSATTTTTPVPPEDEVSLFDPPPDVIYLPASCSSPASPQAEHTAGGSKHITETVEISFQLHCKAAIREGLPSPAIAGADPSVPIDVGAEADSTPRGGTGRGKRGNKQLATRAKAAKRHGQPPILVSSSPSTRETPSGAGPVGEGSKPGVPPVEKDSKLSASTVAAARRGEDSVHVSKSGFPPERTPLRFSDSPAAPSLNIQTGDTTPTPFCRRNPKFDSWLRQPPIPASLEELLRLFVSSRQRHRNENVLDVYASIDAVSPPKWHRPGGYDK